MTVQQTAWIEPPIITTGGDEAYSPPWLVEAAREVLGGIDLDPCSCAMAQQVVQASAWYDEARNGLIQHWRGRLWLNPPFSDSLPWVVKALRHWHAGDVPAALLLVRGDTSTEYSRMLAWAGAKMCLLERVQFWPQRINAKTGKPSSPDFPVLLWYLGPDVVRFRAVFDPRYGPIP